LIEANNPIDVGQDQIEKYQGDVEDILNGFHYVW